MYNTETMLLGAKLIGNNDLTVRAAAAQIGVSKSGLHKYCCEGLAIDNPAVYREVQAKFKRHLEVRHLNGGEATRRKYAGLRLAGIIRKV